MVGKHRYRAATLHLNSNKDFADKVTRRASFVATRTFSARPGIIAPSYLSLRRLQSRSIRRLSRRCQVGHR